MKNGAPLHARNVHRKAPIDLARDKGFTELSVWLAYGEHTQLSQHSNLYCKAKASALYCKASASTLLYANHIVLLVTECERAKVKIAAIVQMQLERDTVAANAAAEALLAEEEEEAKVRQTRGKKKKGKAARVTVA